MAIVTGAALGIGQAIARRLAEAGAAVAIAAVAIEAAQAAATAITEYGAQMVALRADARSAAVQQTVAQGRAGPSTQRLDATLSHPRRAARGHLQYPLPRPL